MKQIQKEPPHSRKLLSVYELLVWVLYAMLYKYALIIENPLLPRLYVNFPFPELLIYALCITVYIIPYYRWIGPRLLEKRKFVTLFFVSLAFFLIIPKFINYPVNYIFLQIEKGTRAEGYFKNQYHLFSVMVRGIKFPIQFLMTDMLAFFSVMFLRFAMKNENRWYQLEKDNLTLQLETLKAQLHPHFLFNTLNSIYGMSLTGAKETPAFILRLSNMMRYILYDCRHHRVAIAKDIDFLNDYLEMEKKRYPEAQISFEINNRDIPETEIAPLLLIPFLENSFKHGAHRVNDNSFISGSLYFEGNKLKFQLQNSVLLLTAVQNTMYGGVGIENVKKRLELYYPGKYNLNINHTDQLYTVDLEIQLAV